MGREEFFTLFSHTFQRGAERLSRHLSHSPSTASLRVPARAQSPGDFAALGDVAERTFVLRTLIEEFGGEAVSSTLRRRLVRLVRWKEAKSDFWMRVILGELEHCGALTLEEVNGTEVIARIQPVGVILAYDLPASNHAPGRSVTS